VLDRLEASLCRTVTGIAQSAELLKALHHEQLLLVTLDEDNGWYRYHHLMSDFLIDRLHARQADQVPELHRRAHRWYSDHRMWNQAVQHAIAARDFDHAFEYVRQCAMPLVIKGDLLTLLAWERQLPPELMSGQIEVKLALVWGLALVTRFSEAETLLEQVEGIAGSDPTSELWLRCRVARSVVLALSDNSGAAYDVASACEDAGSLDPFNLNSVWNVMRYGYWKAGDWDSFYAVPKPDERGDEATYVLAENYRLCLYGMVAAHRLEVDNALQYYGEARALAEKHVGPKSVSAVMVTGLRSLMRYERGDISSAEIAVLDEIDIIDTTVYHESFLSAYLTLVRAAALRDDRPRALMLLNRAERLASDRGWMRLVAILLTERVRLLVMDKADEARLAADQLNAICEQHPAPSRCAWSDIHTFAAVSEGLLMAEAGAFEQAGERLKWAYQELASTNNRHEGLRVGLELSSVLLRAGARTEALEALAQVIGWSTEAGVETYLLERRQEARSLLAVALEEPVANIQLNQEFRRLTDLLGASAAASAKLEEGRGSRQALSAREQSIVGFIANGQSNKQIARTLGVTPETVKTHIKRIFVKLSAETRAQAVVRAQRLGLLHGQS
jgi:LuxR family maltose regulon positive regulatory protein